MSFTFGQCERQCSNLLGNVLGTDLAAAETNYLATASATNRSNPDFPASNIQDAIVNAVTDIVLAIAETPRHPERQNLQGLSNSLGNRSIIPSLDSLGSPFVGIKGRVFDSASGKSCLNEDVDSIRSFNEHTGVYSGFSPFWYAYNGNTIEHTRASVVIEGCVWVRPTYVTADNVQLADIHESAVVMGAVMRLAPREGMYLDLWNAAEKIWNDHIARIRALGAPEAITEMNSAPTSV